VCHLPSGADDVRPRFAVILSRHAGKQPATILVEVRTAPGPAAERVRLRPGRTGQRDHLTVPGRAGRRYGSRLLPMTPSRAWSAGRWALSPGGSGHVGRGPDVDGRIGLRPGDPPGQPGSSMWSVKYCHGVIRDTNLAMNKHRGVRRSAPARAYFDQVRGKRGGDPVAVGPFTDLVVGSAG